MKTLLNEEKINPLSVEKKIILSGKFSRSSGNFYQRSKFFPDYKKNIILCLKAVLHEIINYFFAGKFSRILEALPEQMK